MSYTPTGAVQDQAVVAELLQISRAIQELTGFYIPVVYAAPDKPQRGQLVYADAGSWDPGSGTGVYSFDGSIWNKIGTASGGGATQLSELSDVSTVGYTNRHVLAATGSVYASRALIELDISDLGTYISTPWTSAINGGGYGLSNVSTIAATSFNGVALTTGGVATNYLDETGSYSEPAGGGGTDFLDISEFDDTDATYYYYGGLDTALDWKINRYHKTTFIKTSADEAGNPTKTSLALAWADRTTLSYS